MVRLLTRAATAGLLLPLLLLPAPGRAAVTPEVHVDSQARQGQFNTITGSLRFRCAAGLVAEVRLTWSQAGFTSPEAPGRPASCTGGWQRQAWASYEGFDPGPAVVRARLLLTDAQGTPRGGAVQTKQVYARPAAKVVLPRTALLRPRGVVRVVVRARCDRPWVLAGFHVAATQGQRTASRSPGLRCDGVEHDVTVWLKPAAGRFRAGWLDVSAEVTLLDAVHQDPVAQARASRSVRVVVP
ncbi:hypothetical protein [Nocardioides sp. SYSU D00038]|uniref:hypothetical protein n=1 Tax=Nocardioides sp. SYSU D00038 TaxID=2812554 RepID=UPI001967EFFC|nr:hypothetical protein [Nocardioides sp. SYSU D00038]